MADPRVPIELTAVWSADRAVFAALRAAEAGKETGYAVYVEPTSLEAVVLELVAVPSIRRPLREMLVSKLEKAFGGSCEARAPGSLPGRSRVAFRTGDARLVAVSIVQ